MMHSPPVYLTFLYPSDSYLQRTAEGSCFHPIHPWQGEEKQFPQELGSIQTCSTIQYSLYFPPKLFENPLPQLNHSSTGYLNQNFTQMLSQATTLKQNSTSYSYRKPQRVLPSCLKDLYSSSLLYTTYAIKQTKVTCLLNGPFPYIQQFFKKTLKLQLLLSVSVAVHMYLTQRTGYLSHHLCSAASYQ